ncbi:unnamed protein product [Meganyctiphanes norvegica]|uniref:Tudor domain-containing protein n=1 Tax=Meganyctiphanes norvegica TaxID=48144 RepID=A0AAV2RI30_MEGNR
MQRNSQMWIAGDQNKTWKNLHVCQAEDAGTFWVREVPSSKKSEELTRFLNLENQMNDYFKKKRANSNRPNIRDLVCVSIKDCWFRGRVDKFQEASKYENEFEVFLLDYGEKVWIKERDLVCLKPGEWSSVPYQSKRVRLWAIKPTTLNYAFTKDGVKVISR